MRHNQITIVAQSSLALPAAHCLLPTAYCLLPTAYCLLPTLDASPFGLHLSKGHFAKRATPRGERTFHRLEPPGELVVRAPQRRFGLDPEFSRQVGDRKEQVAHLVLGPRQVAGRARLDLVAHLRDLLFDLFDDVDRARPVEADSGSPRADLECAQKRGQRLRHAAERGLRRACGLSGCRGTLACLERLPLLDNLLRGDRRAVGRVAREHMRMAAHELLRNRVNGVADGEGAGLLADLCQEDRLVQKIAKLFAEACRVAALDRVEHFVRLLENERAQRCKRLLTVPRAAIRRAQRTHDSHQPFEPGADVVSHDVSAPYATIRGSISWPTSHAANNRG